MVRVALNPRKTKPNQHYYIIRHNSTIGSVFVHTYITDRQARYYASKGDLICQRVN